MQTASNSEFRVSKVRPTPRGGSWLLFQREIDVKSCQGAHHRGLWRFPQSVLVITE